LILNKFGSQIAQVYRWVKKESLSVVDDQVKCVNKISEVRMNSVCYTCSARASVFFDKDKLNVDERTCRDVISECSSSWIRMTQYLDYINKFNAILSQLEKKTGIKFSEAIAGKPAKAIHDWADKNHFRQKLRDCQGGVCDFTTAKDICENFFSINNPIYIRQALVVENNIMNREQYVFESLRKKDLNTETKTRTFSELTNKQLELDRKNDKRVVSKAEKFVRMFEEKDQSLTTGRTLLLGFPRPPSATSTNNPSASSTESSSTTATSTPPTTPSSSTDYQSTLQKITENPLICPLEGVCYADKSVLTVTQCTLKFECTNPSSNYRGV